MRRWKREKVLSRRQRLQAISRELEKSMSLDIASLTDEEKAKFFDLEFLLDELYNEIDQWRSGMEGTNLEYTMKYGTLEECQEQLEQLRDMMSYFVSDFKKNINITNNDWEEFEFIAENIVWAGMF